MNDDDSFNDSDEFFSLYSSKKVTNTFKARVKKIAATNHHLIDPFSKKNYEELCYKKLEKMNSEIPAAVKQLKNSVDNEPIEVLENDSLNTSVEIDNDATLEDSVEIITEFIPMSTRRSERLRKKKAQDNLELNQPLSINVENIISKRATRSREKKRKEKKRKSGKLLEITLDDSPEPTETEDELNPELSVKVIWKSVNVKKFQVRKFQKLSCIFEILSKEENIPEDKIILTFNNIRVNRNDTPDSLNLQVYHFLDGGILSELSNSCQEIPSSLKSECNNDFVVLKVQDVNKKTIRLILNKNEKLKVGMIKCSEQLEVPLNKIKFFFDGELLESSETPASLGLESEEVIDLKICS